MKIPYYAGCTLKTNAQNLEESALASAGALGIDLMELPKWNCCGTVFSLTADDLMHHIAPVRNLIRVQEMNEDGTLDDEYRLVTLCSMCFNTIKQADQRVKDPEDLEKINNIMYLEEDYKGQVQVVHFLELLKEVGFDKIKKAVKKPLKDLKISPFYECMLFRPREVGIDDPEDPKIYADLLEALGADVVENPYGKLCCGGYQTVQNKEVVVELAHDILIHAQKEGAEALITSCPLCTFNLDGRQKEVCEKYPDFKPIPVFYFTQLLAIALGAGSESCGFDRHYVDPKPLLEEKNLL
jgi:heterodisulfide reductase subunit B